MIFFHDKHWYRSEPLFSVEEEEEDEKEDESDHAPSTCSSSPTSSQATITSARISSDARKPEYEFLLFNYLLRFVHREGQIGDFARAGLLFLMDVAMSPGEPTGRVVRGERNITPEETVSDPISDAALSLAEYIVDGDFSEVLAAGLGAVYSLLPSKLDIRASTSADMGQNNGMVLGRVLPRPQKDAELPAEDQPIGLENSNNPDFRFRLDHFLKLLEFLQDIVRRNVLCDHPDKELDPPVLVGVSIVQSILDAVRRIFLESVLYPSILECSDLDGSAVAVMSYVDIMIRTLENGQLSDVLVKFLMSEDDDNDDHKDRSPRTSNSNAFPPWSRSTAPQNRQTKLHRRKSSAMILLELEAAESRRPSEYFTSMGRFTLKDLLLSNLRSQCQPAVTAALQLFQTIITHRCRISTNDLIHVIPDPNATSYPEPIMVTPDLPSHPLIEGNNDEFMYPGAESESENALATPLPSYAQPDTTYTTHEREVDLYLTLVSRLHPSHSDDVFSTGYEHYLRDAFAAIQHHHCFAVDLADDIVTRTPHRHHLNTNDPILSAILENLCRFFSNAPETNVSLTGIVAELALCPDRSIDGWLTFTSSDALPMYLPDHFIPDDMRDDQSIDCDVDEKLATETNILPAKRLDGSSRPTVHSIFQGLIDQLERYRQLVDNFDGYLLERRQGLLFSENLTDALTVVLQPKSPIHDQSSTSILLSPPTTPSRPKAKPRSLVSFLTPRKSKSVPLKPQISPEPRVLPQNESRTPTISSSYASHYQQTRDIIIEPSTVSLPSSGLRVPMEALGRGGFCEEDVFFESHWGEERSTGETVEPPVARATLSHLLDNVVILEECIKELVAIIQARRGLGIDSLRYV